MDLSCHDGEMSTGQKEKNKQITKQHVYNMTLGLFGVRYVYGGLCMPTYVYIIKIWREKKPQQTNNSGYLC